VASALALIGHLMVLAVLLLVPRHVLEDEERPQALVVTLVTEPPAAEAQPDLTPPAQTPPAQTPPVASPPEPPPPAPLVNPPPPPEVPLPEEPAVAPPDTPLPPPPPPPEVAVPTPAAPPPRKPVAKPGAPRPRLTAPTPNAAPPASSTPAQPRAPVAIAPSADVIGAYRNSLAAHVQPYQRYPALARARREEGLVVLHVTIRRDGQIAAMSIEHGSGSDSLDREALAALKRADPLPPVPAGVPGTTMDLVFPLRFHLE
jgi:protein TonB